MRLAIEIVLFPLWALANLVRTAFWGLVILLGFVV